MKPHRTRLYLPNAGESLVTECDPEILEISHVLRLEVGEWVIAFNGDGKEYFYQIEASSRKSLHLTLAECHENPRDLFPAIAVYLASTKGSTRERMVKDLTPLGATRIVFYRAERSVARPDVKGTSRLEKIAVEACRQCGRSTIPVVTIFEAGLSDLEKVEGELPPPVILFWEKEESPSGSILAPNEPISLVFGPEGGFTEDEVAWARSYGCRFYSLGDRILRSELAAVAGMVLVQAERGVLGKRTMPSSSLE